MVDDPYSNAMTWLSIFMSGCSVLASTFGFFDECKLGKSERGRKRRQITSKYSYYRLMFRAKDGKEHANDRRVIGSAHARTHGKISEPIQVIVRNALDDANAKIRICGVFLSDFNTVTIQFLIHSRDDPDFLDIFHANPKVGSPIYPHVKACFLPTAAVPTEPSNKKAVFLVEKE